MVLLPKDSLLVLANSPLTLEMNMLDLFKEAPHMARELWPMPMVTNTRASLIAAKSKEKVPTFGLWATNIHPPCLSKKVYSMEQPTRDPGVPTRWMDTAKWHLPVEFFTITLVISRKDTDMATAFRGMWMAIPTLVNGIWVENMDWANCVFLVVDHWIKYWVRIPVNLCEDSEKDRVCTTLVV